MNLTWASERHLRLAFEDADPAQVRARILQAAAAIEGANLPGLVDITPAYSTILLEFDVPGLVEAPIVESVRAALAHASQTPVPAQTPIVEIPVCYEGPCAPDAEDVARLHGLDVGELARLHAEPLYVVRFIGFAPGFAYLDGLPAELATPRLATPRVRVPAGSVGIAAEQTGIYPATTAGGWRLIGRTPLVLFDARRVRPALLSAGDRVRFRPIRLSQFEAQWQSLHAHE